jgi:hypothetical protein
MTATTRDLSPAQTSAALVTATRLIKSTLAGYKSAGRAPSAGWDERACALGRLQGVTQEIASCINHGGHAVSNSLTGLPGLPGTLPGWIESTTYAAACEVQEGANTLRAYRGLQRSTARPLKMLQVARAADQAIDVLYDLLVRKSGTSRLRPRDAPEFVSLLAECCNELAAVLRGEAKHTKRILGDDPAEALIFAARQATQGRTMLVPVIREVKRAAARPPARRGAGG